MTNEQKKSYLSKYRVQQAKIRRINQMIIENPQLKAEYAPQLAECHKIRKRIEKAIEAVDGNILSEILYQKYLCGKTLEEISYTLNYSKRHIERMHIAALQKLTFADEFLPNSEKNQTALFTFFEQ